MAARADRPRHHEGGGQRRPQPRRGRETPRGHPAAGRPVRWWIGFLSLALILVLAAPGTAPADPAERWRGAWPATDFDRHAVPLSEIRSGGPPRDGIPPIEDPRFEAVEAAQDRLAGREPVIALEIDGDARAYPLSILIWHEIVNDTVGGMPVAVTYCPLCNTAIVFERRVDGTVTTFGTTGKLRHSDLVMYDRATESWWQQYGGRAIVGEMTGAELDAVPSRLESVADFAARHPEGRVLRPPDGSRGAYGRNPYEGYDRSSRPFLYDGRYDGPGSPLMRVVTVPGRAEAWSLALLRERGTLRAGDLVLRWRPGQASALDTASIARGRDVGSVTVTRVDSDGTRRDVVHMVPFAFAFRAFNPGAPIHHPE